jgi:hypothetical protein
LKEQQDCATRQSVIESREVNKRLQRSKEHFPDADSDDEDSLSDNPNFKSGGDKVDEQDMWSNHPASQLDFDKAN